MYDLEIIVPAETNSPLILERFEDFKKWGFQNIGNTKIRLILLASFDNDPSCLIDGWPEGITAETIVTPYKHVSQRIYYYYSSLIKPNTAHWYMRVDEDSMTDIGGLMANINGLFDPDREYHINCDTSNNIESIEYNVLSNIGYNWWFTHEETYPCHDYEVSITSNAAINRIFKNPDTYNYLNLRQEFAEGHGDHGLCYCARMSKIHNTEVEFMTREPFITKFSMFGGYLNHIHHIAKDQNPCIYNFLNTVDVNKLDLLRGQTFIFHEEDEYKKEWILLKPNQTTKRIIMAERDEEEIEIPKLWGITEKEEIVLLFTNFEKNDPFVKMPLTNGSYKFRQFRMIKTNKMQ